MKISIVKPDSTSIEIDLYENQPTLETINNELLLFENCNYKLIIRSAELVDNAELFVGDYSVPLSINENTGCLETGKELIFNGCFDLTYISVCLTSDDGIEDYYYSSFIRVATTKQTIKQVELMLEEIEKHIPNFLDICFSRNRKKSGVIKNDVRSIWNTLKILERIISVYEENYSNFYNYKKSEIENVSAIVDSKQMRIIDQESLRWIVRNPDYLKQVEEKTGIEVAGKNYIPTKVRTYKSEYSYDLYENQVVLGFLGSVLEYVRKQMDGFEKAISQLNSIPNKIVAQIPNTHDVTGRCVYIYYKGVVNKYLEVEEVLRDLYGKYEIILDCVPVAIDAIPKLTNTFKQIHHYRSCYECIVRWFDAGDYSFEHLNYLFKLKTLSRIFEYYSLIKMQLAITELGYEIKETNKIIYNDEDYVEDINNEYIFNNGKYELKLLYEPYIWTQKLNEGMNLYSTGYNFNKCKWNDKWTPDFVIKITGEYDEYYFIFDAKYSNIKNVKSRYIPELVLKYSTQIASANKYFSQVIGVGAIYPMQNSKEEMTYFKRKLDARLSLKISLPSYFALPISKEDSENKKLSRYFYDIFEIVDVLEKEYVEDYNSVRNTVINNTEDSLKETLYEKKTERKKEPLNKESVLSKNVSDIITMKESENLIVKRNPINIKKCFYYGKGRCLAQKSSKCTTSNLMCEKFILKNEKKLITEEYTCRNLIQYTNKNRVKRVECSVSGNPGCVGTENCVYYLKKKKI